MTEAKAAVIHTDGACLGNPGPAGAGFVIASQGGEKLAEGSVPIGRATNNIAEYQAVISALEAARDLGLTHLVVRSDSELLCKQIWGQYRVKNPQLQKMHMNVRQLMQDFQKVLFQHVPREKNERADELAGKAAQKAKQMR